MDNLGNVACGIPAECVEMLAHGVDMSILRQEARIGGLAFASSYPDISLHLFGAI